MHHALLSGVLAWPWVALALLGAFHGLNPAMGWLFAVGLGLQERRPAAVLRAIPPIAAGHAASVAAVLLVVGVAGRFVSAEALRVGAALVLVAFAVFLVVRRFKHPVRVGMRVGWRDLVVWSWLMATAHGAGLMMLPVVLAMAARAAPGTRAMVTTGGAALVVHTAALFATMTVVALLVYGVFGVRMLRRAWVNLDYVWAGALVVAGGVTLLA
jgi:hypothetical protein